MAHLPLDSIGSPLETFLGAEEADANRTRMAALDAGIAEKKQVARDGWGSTYVDRVHAKGKWTAWERVERLMDPGTSFREMGSLVNWGVRFEGSKRAAPGAGVLTGVVKVHDRWVVVIANDNTVASGAWWPKTPEKIQRAQQLAQRLRIPVVYLVDCSGLFLPEQSRSFSGPRGAGHIFAYNARLAADGVPQVAGVFGDCIAGGGYMPIISDRVVMTESAYMVIAGAALIRGAKAQKLTSLGIGGAEVHVHASGCADERVPDDQTAIQIIREEVSKLPASAAEFYRHGRDPAPPKHPADELSALFPSDPRHAYDVEEVVARLVDSSLFHEVLPHCGREVYTGVGRIGGLWVGLIGNRQGVFDEPGQGKRLGGVLYREGIAKLTTFVRTCADDGVPVIWLQDISGFDIGVEAERQGLLGFGSNLIYTNSTHTVPVFTVLLRKVSGAGYYAMSGMPYEPILQLATPLTRLAVMEGRTLAIAAFNSKLDDDFNIATDDPKERAQIETGMDEVANRIEMDMSPVRAASRMDVDEIVSLATLRDWLECLVEMSWQSIGYRRTKNPRIWSLHDLNVLLDTPRIPQGSEPMTLEEDRIQMPISGKWEPSVMVGQGLVAGCILGHVQQGRKRVELRAPSTATGLVVAHCAAGGVLGVGDMALKVRAATQGASVEIAAIRSEAEGAPPVGVTVVCAETEGVVYLSPKPGEPPFVQVNQRVETRATLALVEVMKTFGSIRAPHAGAVSKVLVSDGDAVSSGDALIWLRAEDDSC